MIYNVSADPREKLKVGAFLRPVANEAGEKPEQFFLNPALRDLGPLAEQDVANLASTHRIEIAQKVEKALPAPGGFDHNRLTIMSDALRHAIETIEPDRHQFIDIPQVFSRTSKADVPGKWCVAHVYQEARTVDLERSKLNVTVLKHLDNKEILSLFATTAGNRVVYETAADGRHLWRDDITKDIFCDQEFKDKISEYFPDSGIAFLPCTVLPK